MFAKYLAVVFEAVRLNIPILVVILATAVVVRLLVFYVLERYIGQKINALPKNVSLRRHFFPSFLFLLIGLALIATFRKFRIEPEYEANIARVIRLFTIFSAAWFSARIVKLGRIILFENLDITITDNLVERSRRTQIIFIEKMLLLMVWFIGTGAVLYMFEGARKFGASLLASAGVAGVVIGFAAQRSLSNVLAGFQIAFTQPIRIDDVVVVEKEWGKIEEITLTYVVVRLWDLRRLILPITYFAEKPFENWTRTSSQMITTAFIYVDYCVSVEELRVEFRKVLRATPLWDGDVAELQVTGTTERTVEVRTIMSAADSSKAFDLKCYVREKLISYMQTQRPQHLPKSRIHVEHDTRLPS
ncbi:MAG TPA: mechanosensitive ion channel [Oligoflexia bacterium]|nr:mechanosensitive ion channel [Oligoflexia bacterium]